MSGGALANTITLRAPAKPVVEEEGTTRLDDNEEFDVSTTTATGTPAITTTETTTLVTTISEAETATTTVPTTTTATTKAPFPSRGHTRVRFRPIPRRPFGPSFPSLPKDGVRHLGIVSLRPSFSSQSQGSDTENTPATKSSPAEEDKKEEKREETTSLSPGEEEESTTEAAVLSGVTR